MSIKKRKHTIKRLFTGILECLCLYTFCLTASAEAVLPNCLSSIGEEAFAGDGSLDDVILSESVMSIESRAFADTMLHSITIPSTVINIAEDSFANVATPFLILSEPGAVAVSYALNHNIDFRAETISRALIIGQTNYPGIYKLNGPGKDIEKIQTALDGFDITIQTDLTSKEIENAIDTVFSESKDEDISLLYYSGHGNQEDGSLVGIDLASRVTAEEIRKSLDAIPGRKIVVIDACYSGALIGKAIEKDNECNPESDPAEMFVEAFRIEKPRLRSTIASSQCFVMVSSKSDEESWEASYGGIFTDAFVKSRTLADVNQDNIVTLQEAYQYTSDSVQKIANSGGKKQTVQVYPENCGWFGLFR